MRKLSGRQAAINAATGQILRQLLQQGQGKGQGQGRKPGGAQPGGTRPGGGGKALAEAREQARKAQQSLAKQLRELAEKYGGEETGPGGKKRMEALEQEARRLARMLENPTPEVRERQDRFLARMLETTLSLHKEGQGKQERQSKSAARAFTDATSDGPVMEFADTDTYYRLRQKAFQSNIPPQYRTAVKAYFDSLGVLYLRQEQ